MHNNYYCVFIIIIPISFKALLILIAKKKNTFMIQSTSLQSPPRNIPAIQLKESLLVLQSMKFQWQAGELLIGKIRRRTVSILCILTCIVAQTTGTCKRVMWISHLLVRFMYYAIIQDSSVFQVRIMTIIIIKSYTCSNKNCDETIIIIMNILISSVSAMIIVVIIIILL